MQRVADLTEIISRDPVRLSALAAVRSLMLADCWIGAGFVRDAVWNHLHGYVENGISGDVDVVWFGTARSSEGVDREIEQRLFDLLPKLDWSVKNQARMHLRNGDEAYTSVADAMRNWPETATAVALRLGHDDCLEINAPFGLEDLFALRLVPTLKFAVAKQSIFQQRFTEKRWIERYPLLKIAVK